MEAKNDIAQIKSKNQRTLVIYFESINYEYFKKLTHH